MIVASATGNQKAVAVCDDCGHREYVTVDYERRPGGAGWRPNEGQALLKLTRHGWAHVRGRLRCMACELARKSAHPKQEKTDMPKSASDPDDLPRGSTPQQEVEIIVMLATVYDRAAGRYGGQETDRTVAEAVGGGCMPGWVSAIRAAKFGPAGNQEVEAIRADIGRIEDKLAAARTDTEAMVAQAVKQLAAWEKEIAAELAALRRRLEGAVAAHDRRVAA